LYRKGPNHLALLSVCRQLYTDTALLPFSLNTFAFRSIYFREFIISKLTPAQNKAIRTIQIHLHLHVDISHRMQWFNSAGNRSGLPGPRVVANHLSFRLPRLQKIVIKVSEVGAKWLWNRIGIEEEKLAARAKLREWLHEGHTEDVDVVIEEDIACGGAPV